MKYFHASTWKCWFSKFLAYCLENYNPAATVQKIWRNEDFYGVVLSAVISAENFKLTILHTNDLHCHYDEIGRYDSPCNSSQETCFGGIHRLAGKIKEIRASYENVILLDGGDVLTRSIWYEAYQGNASAIFLNKIKYDAMVRFILIN